MLLHKKCANSTKLCLPSACLLTYPYNKIYILCAYMRSIYKLPAYVCIWVLSFIFILVHIFITWNAVKAKYILMLSLRLASVRVRRPYIKGKYTHFIYIHACIFGHSIGSSSPFWWLDKHSQGKLLLWACLPRVHRIRILNPKLF